MVNIENNTYISPSSRKPPNTSIKYIIQYIGKSTLVAYFIVWFSNSLVIEQLSCWICRNQQQFGNSRTVDRRTNTQRSRTWYTNAYTTHSITQIPSKPTSWIFDFGLVYRTWYTNAYKKYEVLLQNRLYTASISYKSVLPLLTSVAISLLYQVLFRWIFQLFPLFLCVGRATQIPWLFSSSA